MGLVSRKEGNPEDPRIKSQETVDRIWNHKAKVSRSFNSLTPIEQTHKRASQIRRFGAESSKPSRSYVRG